MSITRMLCLSALIGLAACSSPTDPNADLTTGAAPVASTRPGDRFATAGAVVVELEVLTRPFAPH
ncbi:MAG TPA: hypothetical protein VI297_05800 [Gemmatimonadales bacterium]